MASVEEIDKGPQWQETAVEVADGVKIRGEYALILDSPYYPEGKTLIVRLMDWPRSIPKMRYIGGNLEECAKALILAAFEVNRDRYLHKNPDKNEEYLLDSLRKRS